LNPAGFFHVAAEKCIRCVEVVTLLGNEMSELGVGFGELRVLGVEFVEVFFEFGDAGDEFGSVDLLDLGAEGSL
jgi:hypothetical protein